MGVQPKCGSETEKRVSSEIRTRCRAIAEGPRDAAVNFGTYQSLQRHRAVIFAIAQLSCLILR